jgi:nitrite reductase (NADH) small subunit
MPVSVFTWVDVCAYDDLMPERGAAALVRGRQIAVFRTFDGDLYALGNRDPFSGAYVMARGILGTRGGVPTVASPMYKQVFDLRTGRCLDDPGEAVPVFRIRRTGAGRVELADRPHVDTAANLAPDRAMARIVDRAVEVAGS